jgi:hypothetical protein
MISDLLLDINVVVDICARRHPYFADAVKALDKAIINPIPSTWIRIWSKPPSRPEPAQSWRFAFTVNARTWPELPPLPKSTGFRSSRTGPRVSGLRTTAKNPAPSLWSDAPPFSADDDLAEKMRQIRVHGQKVKHQHPLVGINGRLDTLQAAILLEKFQIFPEECHLRREAGKRYDELLSGLPGIQTPAIAEGNDSVYAQYTILSEDRDDLSQALKVADIPSVAYYTVPLHLQGAFADLGHKPGDFPEAEKVAAQCLSLPMSPYLLPADQESIAMTVKKYFHGD